MSMAVSMIPAFDAWMVFWLNITTVLVITTLGGPALQHLYLRPVSALLGAAHPGLKPVQRCPREFLQAINTYLQVQD